MRQLFKKLWPLQLCAPSIQVLAPRQELLQGCLTRLPEESGTCALKSPRIACPLMVNRGLLSCMKKHRNKFVESN